MAEEGVPPASATPRAELALQSMKLSELKRKAREVGVDAGALTDAYDAKDVQAAVIGLILGKVRRPAEAQRAAAASMLAALRAELDSMKISAIARRAQEMQIEPAKLEEADDAEDIKEALVGLILEKTAELAAAAAQVAEPDSAAILQAKLDNLRSELSDLKVGAIRKKAIADYNVDRQQLDAADDADNIKEAIISLILSAVQAQAGRESAAEDSAAAAAAAAALQMAKAKLREELSSMTPSFLKKRAAAEGVSEEAIEEAYDADDLKEALVGLIIDKVDLASAIQPQPRIMKSHAGSIRSAASSAQNPAPTGVPGLGPAPGPSALGQKHIMLSYQWSVQKEVIKARQWLNKHGYRSWMDIDGGVQSDIYESMASGVQNAAVMVCFMTQEYEDSPNCALELKFAKQSGVPIVPVLMQQGYTAAGWLGILTAGLIWTPLYDEASFELQLESLNRQLKLAISSEDGELLLTASDFTVDDVKDELLRLRDSTTDSPSSTSTAAAATGTGLAPIPAVVPLLPAGICVTVEMQQLLTSLVETESTRVGFCGMGGIGKTVISSWLARQDSVRKAFDKICWVTLGQLPSTDSIQESVFTQLTGLQWNPECTDDKKKITLQRAFAGHDILLVLDDLWDPRHEEHVSFLDPDTKSKILVSSRVKGIAAGNTSTDPQSADTLGKTFVVDIRLPNEDDAVRMLLSTGGMALSSGAPPPEALELCRFCNFLPLAISIAGQLVKDLELDASADWTGIVSVMKQEFKDNNSRQSVEEAVILTSLKGLQATAQQKNAVSLFYALALVPEDIRCPLEIMAMLFEACAPTNPALEKAAKDVPTVKRPSIMSIRRMLKTLINRSLVIGTVDRPQLHDIVRDFVIGQHEEQALSACHLRFVNILRASRPIGYTGQPEWTNSANDAVGRYVKFQVGDHLRNGFRHQSDDAFATEILCDLPHDDISRAAVNVLGCEKVLQLSKAETTTSADKNMHVRLASHAAIALASAARTDEALALKLQVIEEISALSGTVAAGLSKDNMDRLEMHTVMSLNAAVLQPDIAPLVTPRLNYLKTTDVAKKMPAERGLIDFFLSQSVIFDILAQDNGDTTEFVHAWLKFPLCLAEGARSSSTGSRTARDNCMIMLMTCVPWSQCMRHVKWEAMFGQDGSFILGGLRLYQFDTHHEWVARIAFGADWTLSPMVVSVLALRWGNVAAVLNDIDTRQIPCLLDRVIPDKTEALLVHISFFLSVQYWQMLGRGPELARLMEAVGSTWSTADETFDRDLANNSALQGVVGQRGSTVFAGQPMCTEYVCLFQKLAYVLVAPEPGVSGAEIVESLPSIEKVTEWANSGWSSSWCCHIGSSGAIGLLCAQVCEKFGYVDAAFPWLEMHLSGNTSKGAAQGPNAFIEGNRAKGRCLAKVGKHVEALVALEAAIKEADETGFFLLELLALEHIIVHVEESTLTPSRGSKAQLLSRMKVVVTKMFGGDESTNTPIPRDMYEPLSVCLVEVSIDDVMAAAH